MSQWHCILRLSITVLFLLGKTVGLGDIIYAVNCGGEAHTDVYGVQFQKDSNKVGTASDFGKQLIIGRIAQQDQTLYQTERYHTSMFGYDLPLAGDGDYLLVLKLSEVYFNAPNMKVFDIVLNGDIMVVSDLDVFERVGRGVAHDEYIEFRVENNKILFQDDESEIRAGMIRIEFIKSIRDNPKINAIVLMKGKLSDWPQLPPPPLDNEEEDYTEPIHDAQTKRRNPSGPKVVDPYTEADSTSLLPVFVAIGAFFPILICLCKL